MLKITMCPSCGSEKIKRVRRDWRGTFHGPAYVVPGLSFYECSQCGERVYDREAMRKIEARSPAFLNGPSRRSTVTRRKGARAC